MVGASGAVGAGAGALVGCRLLVVKVALALVALVALLVLMEVVACEGKP